jgi:predicted DNA-binding ribbon-helix-helix protein
MAISDLSSAQIPQLLALLEQKQKLSSHLSKIEAELFSLETGASSTRTAPKTKVLTGRRRGVTLKEGIWKELSTAGKKGLSIAELASKLNRKQSSVSVWFYTAAKKIKTIRKVARGRYALTI